MGQVVLCHDARDFSKVVKHCEAWIFNLFFRWAELAELDVHVQCRLGVRNSIVNKGNGYYSENVYIDLPLILSYGARIPEGTRSVETLHGHGAACHDLVVDSPRFTIIVKDVFLDHKLCLRLTDWNKTGLAEFVVARSNDIFSLNRSGESWLRYLANTLCARVALSSVNLQAPAPILK